MDDGQILEVTRTATDGVRNANSLLYGACWRAAKALGYTWLVTYKRRQPPRDRRTVLAQRPPRRGWHCASRPRTSHGTDHVARTLWEASA